MYKHVSAVSESTLSIDHERENMLLIAKRLKEAEENQCEKIILVELKLIDIPQDLFYLTFVKKLCLSRNCILMIPEELCIRLQQLTWLDLRQNLISRLPTNINSLGQLQVLLLDDNRIRVLPFELGLMKSLRALNIHGNPVEFPSSNVLEKGLKYIMHYLRKCHSIREENGLCAATGTNQNFCPECPMMHSTVSNTGDTINYAIPFRPCSAPPFGSSECTEILHINPIQQKAISLTSVYQFKGERTCEDELQEAFDIAGIVDASIDNINDEDSQIQESVQSDIFDPATIPTSRTYRRIRSEFTANRRKWVDSKRVSLTQSEKHQAFLPDTPPQPSMDKILALQNRRKTNRLRQAKMIQQDMFLQKIRNVDQLRTWKENLKAANWRKAQWYANMDPKEIEAECVHRISRAPYDVNKEDTQMIDSRELEKQRKQHIVSTRPPCLDPRIVLQLEVESSERDKRLVETVSRHFGGVANRTKTNLPTSSEALISEMLIAKRDLDMAIDLHRRVKQRLETLQHFHGSNRRDLWW